MHLFLSAFYHTHAQSIGQATPAVSPEPENPVSAAS